MKQVMYNLRKVKFLLFLYGVLPGILRDNTMDDKLIHTPNDAKQNYPSCRLNLNCGWKSLDTSCLMQPNKIC